MPRPAVALALLLAAAVVAVLPAGPHHRASAAEPSGGSHPRLADPAVARLVAQLADPEYARREQAHKALDAVGPAALQPLRAAARSADPELARRAADLAGRIGRRVENAETLAPTVVALKADRAPLSAVLADLTKQAGFPVALGGPDATDAADDPVTLDTGRVPFWEAVLAVSAAADLRIRRVGDTPAPRPSATQYLNGQPVPEPDSESVGVVLEPRGTDPKRPAAVFGAVLVEAVPVPAAPPADAAVGLLLVWPEPKLNWQAAAGVRIDKAADAGRELAALQDLTPRPQQAEIDRAIVVRQLGGRRMAFDEVPAPPATAAVPGFTPTARQAVVRLKPGAAPPARADLAGAVAGVIRPGPAVLVQLDGLKPGETAEGGHPAGVDLRAILTKKDDRWAVTVDLLYDPSDVAPAGETVAATATGFRDGRTGLARSILLGLRVTDAAGIGYDVEPRAFGRPVRADPGRVSVRVEAVLTAKPARPPEGDPSAVAFWGTYSKPVEVPFALAGVPLTGGFGK